MGKITGRKWAGQAKGLTDLASEKASKAIARQSMGKSYSALMRQSARYTSKAVKPTNIYRGVSSVTGSVSAAVTLEHNADAESMTDRSSADALRKIDFVIAFFSPFSVK